MSKSIYKSYTDQELIESYSRNISDINSCSTKIGRQVVTSTAKKALKEIKRRNIPTYLYSQIR